MKKLFNISEGSFKELISNSLSLDTVFLLEKVYSGLDISSFEEGRINDMSQTLLRKGYVDKEGKITPAGIELYNSIINGTKSVKLKRLVKKDEEWQLFLALYPVNNTFTWKGRKFEGDRGIRKNTEDGKTLFTKILNEGEYTYNDIINAVIAECLAKFESSWKSGENKMKYFVNTESYLRQRGFENYIEEGRELTEEKILLYREAYNRKKSSTEKKNVIDL